MATIQKFEDLICWKKARELANFVFYITNQPAFKDIDLKRQIRRAAISPMSNIAEGFDRGTKAEFIDALFIGKGETGEVRSQLYIAMDQHYLTQDDFDKGMKLTDECARLIQSFATHLKADGKAGLQFKKIVPEDPLKKMIREEHPELYEKTFHEKLQ